MINPQTVAIAICTRRCRPGDRLAPTLPRGNAPPGRPATLRSSARVVPADAEPRGPHPHAERGNQTHVGIPATSRVRNSRDPGLAPCASLSERLAAGSAYQARDPAPRLPSRNPDPFGLQVNECRAPGRPPSDRRARGPSLAALDRRPWDGASWTDVARRFPCNRVRTGATRDSPGSGAIGLFSGMCRVLATVGEEPEGGDRSGWTWPPENLSKAMSGSAWPGRGFRQENPPLHPAPHAPSRMGPTLPRKVHVQRSEP
jgi:hypothetical protein